jgi:hypothetical protein
MYTDPTGHWSCGDQYDPACAETIEEEYQYYLLTNPLPSGMVLPPELPTGVSDMHLLDAFVYLWNTPTGRAFAQTILDANVTLTWGREDQKSQTWESGYMDGSGVLHTDIVVSLNIDNYWHPAAAARDLAHEGVHVHRNDHRDSLWEEYTAYRIESVVSAELNDRYGANLNIKYQFSSNPRPGSIYLEAWFSENKLDRWWYGSLPAYPVTFQYLIP